MADNVALPSGDGAGATIKTDDDGTAHWQYVKLAYGADNTQTRVSGTNPLPTAPEDIADGTPVSGQFTTSTSSQTLIAANAKRKGLTISNRSAIDVYVDFAGGTATSADFCIEAGGVFNDWPGTSAVTIIAASGTPVVDYAESSYA